MVGDHFKMLPGYVGAIPVAEPHPDAIPNGARIRKIKDEPGDMTPLGMGGTVLASLDAMGLIPEVVRRRGIRFIYWVEWDDKPKVIIAVTDWKIERMMH